MNKTISSYNVVSDCCHWPVFRQAEFDLNEYGVMFGYDACEKCGEECGQVQTCECCGDVFNEKGLPSCQCETI